MRVISNSSPIILLEKVGELFILKELYETVIIPEAVYNETFKSYRKNIKKPGWIIVEKVIDKKKVNFLLNTLGFGESEAIVLALEMKTNLLLIDDFRARVYAKSIGINITGVAGILLNAKEKKIISNVKKILDKLIVSDYRISESLYNSILIKASEK